MAYIDQTNVQYRLLQEYLTYEDIDKDGNTITCDGDEIGVVVSWHLNHGWKLYGSPTSVYDVDTGCLCHMQAVFKKYNVLPQFKKTF